MIKTLALLSILSGCAMTKYEVYEGAKPEPPPSYGVQLPEYEGGKPRECLRSAKEPQSWNYQRLKSKACESDDSYLKLKDYERRSNEQYTPSRSNRTP